MLRIIWTNWIWKIDEDWRVNWRRLTYKKQKHSWRLQNKSTKCQNFRKLLFLFFQIYHTGGCKWAVIFLFSFIMCSEMELVHFFHILVFYSVGYIIMLKALCKICIFPNISLAIHAQASASACAWLFISLVNKIHHHLHHYIFLLCLALCYHQG